MVYDLYEFDGVFSKENLPVVLEHLQKKARVSCTNRMGTRQNECELQNVTPSQLDALREEVTNGKKEFLGCYWGDYSNVDIYPVKGKAGKFKAFIYGQQDEISPEEDKWQKKAEFSVLRSVDESKIQIGPKVWDIDLEFVGKNLKKLQEL